jgi:hypothetical protein
MEMNRNPRIQRSIVPCVSFCFDSTESHFVGRCNVHGYQRLSVFERLDFLFLFFLHYGFCTPYRFLFVWFFGWGKEDGGWGMDG